MRVILLRHGESLSNVQNIFAGYSDVPLTERGYRQAESVRELLKGWQWDQVVVSPLERAVETARIATIDKKIEHQTDSRLKEMNFGKWEGLSFEAILEHYPEESQVWMADYLNYICPGGESLKGFYERVAIAYKSWKEDWLKDQVTGLMVVHSGVIRAILASELHQSAEGYWHYQIDNCGFAVLDYEGDYPVLSALINAAGLTK